MPASLAPGLTPEMVAAVSKLMGLQDLIAIASRVRVVTRFCSTVGLPGKCLSDPSSAPTASDRRDHMVSSPPSSTA